jgi:hypothetical protein
VLTVSANIHGSRKLPVDCPAVVQNAQSCDARRFNSSAAHVIHRFSTDSVEINHVLSALACLLDDKRTSILTTFH